LPVTDYLDTGIQYVWSAVCLRVADQHTGIEVGAVSTRADELKDLALDLEVDFQSADCLGQILAERSRIYARGPGVILVQPELFLEENPKNGWVDRGKSR
jgi:hypothetical protein